jgi:hypothetical protein
MPKELWVKDTEHAPCRRFYSWRQWQPHLLMKHHMQSGMWGGRSYPESWIGYVRWVTALDPHATKPSPALPGHLSAGPSLKETPGYHHSLNTYWRYFGMCLDYTIFLPLQQTIFIFTFPTLFHFQCLISLSNILSLFITIHWNIPNTYNIQPLNFIPQSSTYLCWHWGEYLM